MLEKLGGRLEKEPIERCGDLTMNNSSQDSRDSEAWARHVLSRIVLVADSALIPKANDADAGHRNSQGIDPDASEDEFDELRIRGTRTILVEDVKFLEECRSSLLLSFNALGNEFGNNRILADKKETLFAQLGVIMDAAYYIGAYTTITDRIHEEVRYLHWRLHAAILRERKAKKSIGSEESKKRAALRAAVELSISEETT